MWKPLSLNEALRAFASGQNVMVADFATGKCLPLSEVLRRFEEGVLFGVEASEPLTDVVRENITAEEIEDALNRVYESLDFIPGAPDPEQNDTEEGYKVEYKAKNRNNKTVEDVEREYQSRKITDIGKLKACRAAGWTLKKLADEFQCSTQTVRNTLTREGIE